MWLLGSGSPYWLFGGCHNEIANSADSPFLHLMINGKDWVEGMLVLLLCYYHPVETSTFNV
jgi:hypothetical protein